MAGWLCTYSAVNFWFLDCIVYGISKNFEFIWNVRWTKMHPSHFLHLPVWQCCTTSCQPLALLLFHGTGCTYGKQKFSVAQVSITFQAKASLAYDGVSIDTEKAIFGHSCDLLNSTYRSHNFFSFFLRYFLLFAKNIANIYTNFCNPQNISQIFAIVIDLFCLFLR